MRHAAVAARRGILSQSAAKVTCVETGRDTAEARKARGAFFTPPPVSDFIAEWAIRRPGDCVLEPSCGEAAFLISAAARFTALGVQPAAGLLAGVELHGDSARSAAAAVAHTGWSADIRTADFFSVSPDDSYDAVIGNPPYVRYQQFSGENRARARAAALAAGVSLSGLASSWAAFVVHASRFLRRGGRLGLVLPAELLSVNYAANVRRYLMETFGVVRLVLFTERIFPGVQEEVVLLMAEDAGAPGGTAHCELYQVASADQLKDLGLTSGSVRWSPRPRHGKWTEGLLPAAAVSIHTKIAATGLFTTLESWGATTLGMVTGQNRYFALSPSRVAELRLPEHELLPLSPPGSSHLRGLDFSASARKELGNAGARTWLFHPPAERSECSPAARAYLKQGESQSVHTGYKCRVRDPWWRVPVLKPADLLLTYMNADTPRLTTNRAGVHHLNSVHGVCLHAGRKTVGRDLLPVASLNTVTLLGAETVGRSYGGGMLKLEPREADLLPVPSLELVVACADQLRALRPQLAVALRTGRVTDAARLIDGVLLVGGLGLTRRHVRALEEAHAELSGRRSARGRMRRPEVVTDTSVPDAVVL